MEKMRLNRAIAQAGVASRRGAESLIRTGRVKVNGKTITDLATTVDIQSDKLTVDGKRLKYAAKHSYFVLHKPRGVVSTMRDERGRECIADICKDLAGSIRPVGRLDRASEGLLILTDDGVLAQRLTHPSYGVRKHYRVTITPALRSADAEQLVSGVELEDGAARLLQIVLEDSAGGRSRVTVTVDEGRNRLIRRIFEALGYSIRRLKRMQIGSLKLGKLSLGETRELLPNELRELKHLVGMK